MLWNGVCRNIGRWLVSRTIVVYTDSRRLFFLAFVCYTSFFICANSSWNCVWFASVLLSFDSFFICYTVPPMMMIQNQLVGAAIGQNVTLECTSEAFPKSINFWMRATAKNDSIITSGKLKYYISFSCSYFAFFVCCLLLIAQKCGKLWICGWTQSNQKDSKFASIQFNSIHRNSKPVAVN